MGSLKIGDVVEYKGKKWYLYDLYKSNLCKIVVLRNGRYTYVKHFRQGNYEWEEEYLNANIANLPIEEITKV